MMVAKGSSSFLASRGSSGTSDPKSFTTFITPPTEGTDTDIDIDTHSVSKSTGEQRHPAKKQQTRTPCEKCAGGNGSNNTDTGWLVVVVGLERESRENSLITTVCV